MNRHGSHLWISTDNIALLFIRRSNSHCFDSTIRVKSSVSDHNYNTVATVTAGTTVNTPLWPLVPVSPVSPLLLTIITIVPLPAFTLRDPHERRACESTHLKFCQPLLQSTERITELKKALSVFPLQSGCKTLQFSAHFAQETKIPAVRPTA